MKVLLINGSPHNNGCTRTALDEVAFQLELEGVSSQILHIGTAPICGCSVCGSCRKDSRLCIFDSDPVNEAILAMRDCDGLIVGAPVYYSSPNGSIISFMDRMFYASGGFPYKPAAAVVSARRAGTVFSLDVLNKYFSISNMPVVSSQYWNMVHGNTPDEVRRDLEGLQIMRTLGRNMAWLIKSIHAGRDAGVTLPVPEERARTNFIR